MTITNIYDQNGKFQCVFIDYGDGMQTSLVPGNPGWNDYIAKNGMPPATGTPTNPPMPLTQVQQSAIAGLKTYAQSTPASQAANGISAAQDAFNRDLLVVLKLLGSQLN